VSKVADNLKQLPWVTLLLGVVALLVFNLPASIQTLFQYDRNEILVGELWRLFTGHVVHWSAQHLIWDLTVLIACGGLLEWVNRKLMVGILVVGSLLISFGLIIFQSDMLYYRGLSGMDMALFAGICLQAISYCRLRAKSELAILWGLALLGCVLKPAFEIVVGGSFFVSDFGSGVEPSALSHILGIIACLAVVFATFLWRKLWSLFDYNRKLPNHRISEISIF
jgi:rhomboid family GlyGly-CTERM serine protease